MPLQPKPQNKETRANKSATVSKKQSSSIMQKESSAKKVRIQHIEKIVSLYVVFKQTTLYQKSTCM